MSSLPDAAELVKTIKRAAIDAQSATAPVQICFGKVINTSPLQILIDQKLTLGEMQLILTRNVTNYGAIASISWKTETADGHMHEVKGKKNITINNGLNTGDKVVLMRQQGGQKYIVWDKVS